MWMTPGMASGHKKLCQYLCTLLEKECYEEELQHFETVYKPIIYICMVIGLSCILFIVQVMTSQEKEVIKDLSKCNFKEIDVYFKQKSEERKAMSKEDKLKIKEENTALQEEYGYCVIDGHREKIGNFRIEPPSLFRGRGTHPKMGFLKKRVVSEQVIINCSKCVKILNLK